MREGRDSTGDCPRDDKSSLRSHNRQETIWEHLLHAMMPFIRHSPAENGVPLDEYSDECDEPLARRATFDSRMLSQKIFRLKENGKDADRFSKRLKRNRSLEFAGENGATSHRNHLSRLAERIVNFRLPLGLLRRKSSKRRKREMSSNSSANLLSNALISPFLFVNHDENGEKMPPFFLNMLRVNVRASVEGDPESFGFHIDIQYGDLKWTIHRTLIDFLKLHSILNFRHFQGRLPRIPNFPSQLQYALQKAKNLASLSFISETPDKDLRIVRARAQRRKALQEYLEKVLTVCNARAVHDINPFLELPNAYLFSELTWKGKDGWLEKRSGDKKFSCSSIVYHTWNSKWFTLKDSYLAYFDSPAANVPGDVLLFDSDSKVERIHEFSNNPLKRHTLVITNSSRSLKVRMDSERVLEEWRRLIGERLSSSSYSNPNNNYRSFAPVRQKSFAKWFIDAEGFFSDVADSILDAKSCIYISAWWLTPDLPLKRPLSQFPGHRLDYILKRVAERGVKVYVIIYKEVELALSIYSQHTKSILQALHPNIKVIRFPDRHTALLQTGVLYWALHDKSVVIDNDVAYLGGLDICLGRYDNSKHCLGDLNDSWIGMDYSNPRVRDFRNVDRATHLDLIDKKSIPRLPWHDVHVMVKGNAARDIARHFVERWNFIKSVKGREKNEIPYLIPPSELSEEQLDFRNLKGTSEVQVVRSVGSWSIGSGKNECSIYTAYLECISSAQQYIYIENQFFVSSASETSDTNTVKNQISKAIVDRIRRAHQENSSFRVYIVLPLLPAFENEMSHVNGATVRLLVHFHQLTISKGEYSIFNLLRSDGINPNDYITFTGLRTHGFLSREENIENLVTEQIYVHSKIMIIDDNVAIIGSANINDRSMLGNRDGELAVVIRDRQFARSLRCGLFAEHLGISEEEAGEIDIVSENFFKGTWQAQASLNTEIYRQLFRSVPDNTIKTWMDYQNFSTNVITGHLATVIPLDAARKLLEQIKGHIVSFPAHFLENENLGNVFPAKEFVLPVDLFC